MFDTVDPYAREVAYKPESRYPLQGRSVAVFKVATPLTERRRAAAETRAPEPVEVEG